MAHFAIPCSAIKQGECHYEWQLLLLQHFLTDEFDCQWSCIFDLPAQFGCKKRCNFVEIHGFLACDFVLFSFMTGLCEQFYHDPCNIPGINVVDHSCACRNVK